MHLSAQKQPQQTCFMSSYHDNLGKLVPECKTILDFVAAYDGVGNRHQTGTL